MLENLTERDIEHGVVAYLLATGTFAGVSDEVAAARRAYREVYLPKGLQGLGQLPEQQCRDLTIATAHLLLKDLPKGKRTDPVVLGALVIAGIVTRAHVKAAYQRSLISELQSSPEFSALFANELHRHG